MDIKKLYDSGISFEEFICQDERAYREKIMEIYNNIEIKNDLLAKITSINRETNILVFAEIWCPDCVINLPALKKICDLNEGIQMKIIPRKGNEKYLENYKVDGKAKIPTFLFMDGEFKVFGAFIEMPDVIKEVIDKGSQVERIVTKRKYRRGGFTKQTIEDVLKIIN